MNLMKLGCILMLVLLQGLDGAQGATVTGPLVSFDDDDYADLAIGVPYEDLSSLGDAGSVNVLYGTAGSGLSASDDQLWTLDSDGVDRGAAVSDMFGSALASGDFDGDGYADLAIGLPYRNVTGKTDAGAVQILYGTHTGLAAIGNQLWTQDSAFIEDEAEYDDWFGQALAAGDFDGDGYADLAIGVPGENVDFVANAGAVSILYGSANGLTFSGDQFWTQDTAGIQDTAESSDQFGYSLAAGDFDGNGRDDLAIGVVHEEVDGKARAGAVNVLYGSAGGLSDVGDWWFHQNTPSIIDTSEEDDEFGWALATGDLDRDGYADLAIGAPGEDWGATDSAGAVNVVFGSADGLTATGDQFCHQGILDVEDEAEAGDRFGQAVAVGDFDGDGYDDLAAGIPYEDVETIRDVGAVHIFYGTYLGLTILGNFWFHQDTSGIVDTAEDGDRFGQALAAADFDGDRYTDLAIGVPYEDLDSITGAAWDAGAVSVVYGSAGGLTATGNQFWHQDVSGIDGGNEPEDRFGWALVSFRPNRHWIFLPMVVRNAGAH